MSSNPLTPHNRTHNRTHNLKGMPSAKAGPASKADYANELKYMRGYIMMFERTLMLTLTAPSSSSYNSALALAEEYAPALPTYVVKSTQAKVAAAFHAQGLVDISSLKSPN